MRTRLSATDAAVACWALLLSVILTFPLLTSSGTPLARDLIFVPRQPLSAASLGLGDGSPRAVPLDAVAAVLTQVINGGVLATVVLPLSLWLLGWGTARLVRSLGLAAQLTAATAAIWSAWIVERMALGQWALVLGVATLPWVLMAARRFQESGRVRHAALALVWVGVASLTPTGGLLAVGAAVTTLVGRPRRALAFLAVGAVLQAPWIAAAFTGPAAATSDPAGVTAFAPDTEAATGVAIALLGGGGIWDSGAEPATRATWLALVAAALTVAALVAGWVPLRETWGRRDLFGWAGFAAVCAVLPFLASTDVGRQWQAWAIEVIPGAGLTRDSQKFLAPAVILAAACLGAAAGRAARGMRRWDAEFRRAALIPVVLAPILVLPDATTVTWPTVTPARLPAAYETVATQVDTSASAVVTLPWRSYRLFDWTPHRLVASDPATRLFDAEVIVSDDLQVGPTLVRGESPLSAQVGEALERGRPADVLAPLGVGWVLLYPDDPLADQVDVSGMSLVVAEPTMRLYAVPDPRERSAVSRGRAVTVMGAHLLALAVWLGCLAVGRVGNRREGDADPPHAR